MLSLRAAVFALATVMVAGACRVAPSPASRQRAHLVERSGLAMGSIVRLSAWTADEPTALRAFSAVFSEFDRLENLLSVWRHESDVARINAAAGRHAVVVSRDVRQVLRVAHRVSAWTNGKFDVTFGALTDIWKFDHDQDNRVPDQAAIDRRLGLVDYTDIEVDDERETVFLKRPGMRVHLGGIGKGYAVDRAQAILREAGLWHFMIQTGGDLYVAGHHGGKPWPLGLADPRSPERIFGKLELSDRTFSTSGDYERAFLKDGRRFHHLLDPDTGQPAGQCRSVTIVADTAILADGLSTGVFIMGPTDGLALVERLPNVEAIIVTSSNHVLLSTGLQGRFTQLSPPTDGP